MSYLLKNGSFTAKFVNDWTKKGLYLIFFPYFCAIKNEKWCDKVRQIIIILASICLCFSSRLPLHADSDAKEGGMGYALHDSILRNILTCTTRYSGIVQEYEADIYVRGEYQVYKRNGLIRFVPAMFRFYKDVNEYLTEMVGEVHYTAPEVYDMKVRGLTGTFRRNRAGLRNTLEYMKMNVYSPTLLPGMLVSPLDSIGLRYYHYRLDSLTLSDKGVRHYHIGIIPKNKSTQLVSGHMVVIDGTWKIHEICLRGRQEMVDFNVQMQLGDVGALTFLPKRFDVELLFNFLGNKIGGRYSAKVDYTSVTIRTEEPEGDATEGRIAEERPEKVRKEKPQYDLSASYSLKCDTSAMTSDTAYIAALRPFPLTEGQQRLYADYNARKKRHEEEVPETKRKSQVFWGEVGDALISSYTIDLSEMGSVKCSPLINPFLMSYSHSNGFSYRQEFKYNRIFPNDRWIRAVPKIGYNFTRKEFYWSTDFDFYYAPSRLGALTLKVGNGNRIYTSRVVDEIKDLKDSLIDFSKLHLNYFKNMYVQVGNRIELTNGLQLMTALSMHRRKAVRPSELPAPEGRAKGTVSLRPTYTSFAPRVKLTWTPGQYYYMNGRRKMSLHSRYPTFSIDYERGIDGVLGSNGAYERIESDIQHRISLSPMTHLFYRIGGGVFTNQHSVYFVDFANFSRSNLPISWNDDIGGVFQLLDGEWYNASRWYSRAHVTYEAPFLILPHLKKYTSFIDNERLYLSILHTTHLHPYVEAGYGIGSHVFDFGIFVSNLNGEFGEVGCKFTFELFNR